jgi:hypothetical protein
MGRGKRPQAICHPERPHNSKGLCKSCYDREHRKKPHILERERSREQKAYRKAWAKSAKRKAYEQYYYKLKGKAAIKRYKASHRGAEVRRAYDRKQRKENIQFKLANNIRARMHHAIVDNKKAGSAVRDLGCSIDQLKVYLESLFQPGMTWEDRKAWHIDHIIPLASFDLTDREQFLKACHYSNLQPLWARDNLSKGAKIL